MIEHVRSMLKIAAVLSLAAVLGGCAFGQTYRYSDAPVSLQGISSAGAVAVGVQDARPYVTSGGKSESFVGLQRGGFGNPFDVNTQSGGPLANEIRDAIVRALKAKGVSAKTVAAITPADTASTAKRKLLEGKSRRSVLLTLNEWKSDTLMRTDLHYDVKLSVLDEGGAELASNTVKGMDNLGSLGLSPNEGVSRAFAKKLDALFDDEKVIAALK